jgi:hypothetical protein
LIATFHAGDIVYAPLPGMEIVILNSTEIAQELLNKKRNTTARRQVGYLVMNLYVAPPPLYPE